MAIFGIVCIVYLVISFIVFLSFLLTNNKGSMFESIIFIIAVGMGLLWPLWLFVAISEKIKKGKNE